MKITLEVVEGPETGRVFEFAEADSFLVGRSPKAHFVLDPRADQQISRHHCLIDVRPPRCTVQDLESKNGTFVNHQRTRQKELANGDEIQVGRTTMRVLFSDVDDEELPPAQCYRCGQELDLSSPGRTLMCNACSLADLARKSKEIEILPYPNGTVPPSQFACGGCGKDLSDHADKDGRATYVPDAAYLCTDCAKRVFVGGAGGTQLGHYRILREIGRGGMGVVYKAVHEESRRICAVKQILPDVARDDKALKLFDREIGVQSMVVHPNLARVLERSLDNNTYFFVVEYLPGGDLNHLISKVFRGPLEPGLACRFILDVLEGVEALHRHGFVHRDLKPSNFLLTRSHEDPTALAKVTDYGLAKSFEEAGNSLFTRVGEAGGSLMFMPPEQILDYRFVKPPTDVYAVGVSLYLMLTAKYTAQFATPAKQFPKVGDALRPRHPIKVILEDPPIPILERMPQLPKSLARVVDTAVQKDLEKRFTSAAAFAEDLRNAVAKEGLSLQHAD
ncbi:MAG: protein kinase [Thermoanaerobaculales bacterium]|nr:protein kinase [Thermoanaerobaculales bacterium]